MCPTHTRRRIVAEIRRIDEARTKREWDPWLPKFGQHADRVLRANDPPDDPPLAAALRVAA